MPKERMGGQGKSKSMAFSENQKEAIEWYVSGDGMWINQYLRGQEGFGELSDYEKKLLKDLEEATDKKIGETTLYRSVDAGAIFGNMSDTDYENMVQYLNYGPNSFGKGQYADRIRSNTERLIKSADNRTVTEKGFISTTKDYEIARDWGDFSGSNRPVVVEIKTGSNARGADVSYTDKNASYDQKEVLLKNNQRVRYSNVRSKDGNIYVTAYVG